jgi:quinol monooxygenase YgiN
MWHGRVKTGDREEYVRYVFETGIKSLRATPGNIRAMTWCRDEGDETHFHVVSFWESMEAIKRFAGDDYETAVYFPDDGDYLLEFEPGVVHFDVEADEKRAN